MDKVKPAPFEYHAPASLEEAASTLADLGDAAKVLAGGQSLVPMLSLRLTSFDHLVDLGRIDSLRGVSSDGNGDLVIGAMTADRVVGSDSAVASGAPLLTMATPLIGHSRSATGGRSVDRLLMPIQQLSIQLSRWPLAQRSRRTAPMAQDGSQPASFSKQPGRQPCAMTRCSVHFDSRPGPPDRRSRSRSSLVGMATLPSLARSLALSRVTVGGYPVVPSHCSESGQRRSGRPRQKKLSRVEPFR
jgi:FAD binding domain in molybdopterin dehydrogenase